MIDTGNNSKIRMWEHKELEKYQEQREEIEKDVEGGGSSSPHDNWNGYLQTGQVVPADPRSNI